MAGCGDHATSASSYCGDLRAARTSFNGLLDNRISQGDFERLLDTLRSLGAEAPASVHDDWRVFSAAAERFHTALDDAGLTMRDMRRMGNGPMGGGQRMARAMKAARALGAAAVSTALSAITRNAQQECSVSLG